MVFTQFPFLWVGREGKPLMRLVYLFPSLHKWRNETQSGKWRSWVPKKPEAIRDKASTVTSVSWHPGKTSSSYLTLPWACHTISGPESRTLSTTIYLWPWTWPTRACPDSRAHLRLRTMTPYSSLGMHLREVVCKEHWPASPASSVWLTLPEGFLREPGLRETTSALGHMLLGFRRHRLMEPCCQSNVEN